MPAAEVETLAQNIVSETLFPSKSAFGTRFGAADANGNPIRGILGTPKAMRGVEQHPTASTLNAKEAKMVTDARDALQTTKNEFFERLRQLEEVPPDLAAFRTTILKNFDPFIEGVLCDIAHSDEAINEKEAEALNIILRKSMPPAYYNQIAANQTNVDLINTFATVIDIAIQAGGIADPENYDAKADPVVKSVELLGHSILASDGSISEAELRCLTKYTEVAHSKAAILSNRIEASIERSASDELPDDSKSGVNNNATAEVVSIETCLARLHALVGLDSVKREVETLTNLARVFTLRKKRGLAVPDVSFHLIFAGNPGTGKTTVARIVATIYGQLGLLSKGQLVEVDRSGLVGGWTGQTAIKSKKVIEQAKGGVLFIDEAYALARASSATQADSFGEEAIEVILKSMEDYRDDLVVIAAGYTDRMDSFLNSNPGLRSRFPRIITFPDYSKEEMHEIFLREAGRNGYSVTEDAQSLLKGEIQRIWLNRGTDFANARDVRNLFERVVSMQANRISKGKRITTAMLTTITDEDILDPPSGASNLR